MKKFSLVVLLIAISSPAFAATTACQRQLRTTERSMNRTEARCERAQAQVLRLTTLREDAVARIMQSENIANIDEGTDSIKCGIREIFPGECAAKKRRRKAVERINAVNAFYNRRITNEQSNVNRRCEEFNRLREQYDAQRAQCTQ